ncbi:MAG: IS110 family transposase [Firmicutes bacterium]|nr:IS110 family transposase [Bacillota bacterium]NPV93305.1 IS110 family transposase [Bacillota bacterium]
MNAVGIDVSKGKSMVAAMRPFGEVVVKPFEVRHTASELRKLADFLKLLDGETRVIMEFTGKYYQPIARYLHEAGIFVSAVHAKLIHDYGNNSIRKVKTDKADAVKIANYGLTNWVSLVKYTPEDDTRLLLKTYNRQYHQYMKMKVALKNNLIALLDQTFPGANTLFSSPAKADGHEKWVDFTSKFWHCECVSKLTKAKFTAQYNKWCTKAGYRGSDSKAAEIHEMACRQVPTLPCNGATKQLVEQAVAQINAIASTLAFVGQEMQRLAALLPEYTVVMAMYGVGNVLGPQLMAEIGDVRRFRRKQSLIAFAGVDAPPFQSGIFESKDRSISKRGSPWLRKTLFQVMIGLLQTAPADNAVFQFLNRKRAESKRYYVYMIAGCNKFLRIYYARVKESLDTLYSAA